MFREGCLGRPFSKRVEFKCSVIYVSLCISSGWSKIFRLPFKFLCVAICVSSYCIDIVSFAFLVTAGLADMAETSIETFS